MTYEEKAEKYASNSMKEWHGMSYILTEFAEIKIKQAWLAGYEQGIRADVHKLGDEEMNGLLYNGGKCHEMKPCGFNGAVGT